MREVSHGIGLSVDGINLGSRNMKTPAMTTALPHQPPIPSKSEI